MARPYWSGRMQISLVSFGVQLFVATEAKSSISFHQISRSTGERVRHQKVLQSTVDAYSEASPESPVPSAAPVGQQEIVKGYEYEKGQYVLIEPSELASLRVPSKHVIEVTQFVELSELTPEWVEKPYFVTPQDASQAEAFAVVRKALQKTKRVAIGKIAFSGREHVLAIAAAGEGDRGGLMAYTLRYPNELRSQSDYFRDIKVVEINEDSLELAEALIAKRSSKLDMSKFQDGYEVAVKELVDAKIHHLPVPQDEVQQPTRGNVINLMDALRKSIGDGESAKKKPVASVKAESTKGMGLVKASAKAAPRKSPLRSSRVKDDLRGADGHLRQFQ
jgi:DNA end-binding protein Ku